MSRFPELYMRGSAFSIVDPKEGIAEFADRLPDSYRNGNDGGKGDENGIFIG
jgi:hypothetical protein